MSINWNQERFSPRYLIPGSIFLVLVLFSSADLHLPSLLQVFPQLGVMAVFYWGIYWPRLMPYWLVLAVGLLQDTLYGLPLGTFAIANTLLLGVLIMFRRYFVNATFFALWLSFALALLGYVGLITASHKFYYGNFSMSEVALWQWGVSVLVYPSVQRMFFWFHSNFLRLAV
jgi:rod shape-determining protein MreD